MNATPILIAGPTGSGKSALAMALARQFDGVIINADSQQVYAEWQVLSARPTPAEEEALPHLLYGHVSITAAYSVGRWIEEVAAILAPDGGHGPERRPIITGGTGLYFRALAQGLAHIPPVPPEIRAAGEALMTEAGPAHLVAELTARDPETTATLDLANPRRVLRAWEVLEATGTGLAAWKAQTPPPLLPLEAAHAIALAPAREWLYPRLDRRFDQMIEQGAFGEVAQVMALGLPSSLPGTRATGAPELAACLAGELSRDEAIARAKMETRRYAKRQLTWIRNQMKGWTMLDPADATLTDQALVLVGG